METKSIVKLVVPNLQVLTSDVHYVAKHVHKILISIPLQLLSLMEMGTREWTEHK